MLETIRQRIATRRQLYYRSCSPQVLPIAMGKHLDAIRSRIATRRQLSYREVKPQVIIASIDDTFKAIETCKRILAGDGKRVYQPCSCAVCKPEDTVKLVCIGGTVTFIVAWSMPTVPETVKPETQTAFLAERREPSPLPAVRETVNDNIRLKPLFAVDGTASGEIETVPGYVCDECAPLLRVKYRKTGCKACGAPLRNVERPFADKVIRQSKKNGELDVVAHNQVARNKITNDRLFCVDDKETDPFSRTIAVRYLASRMVFLRRSNAKGKKIVDGKPVGTQRSNKTSSAQHDAKVSSNAKHYEASKASAFRASDVEDVVNDAWIIFKTGGSIAVVDGKESVWKLTLTGNRAWDTMNACRMALQRWQRTTYRQTMDIVQVHRQDDEDRERGDINVILRADDVAKMLDVVRVTGDAKQEDIARCLGVSQQAVSKRFAQLRRRILNER